MHLEDPNAIQMLLMLILKWRLYVDAIKTEQKNDKHLLSSMMAKLTHKADSLLC